MMMIMMMTVAYGLRLAISAVLFLSGGRAWRIVPGTSPEARWVRLPWRPEPEELARVCRHTAVLLQLIALDTRYGTRFWAEPKA